MKKNFLIMMMLIIGVSAVGFSKQPLKKPAVQKVCVQKSKKSGKCLKYETRKVNNNKYISKNNKGYEYKKR
jgi:hypothetical protein